MYGELYNNSLLSITDLSLCQSPCPPSNGSVNVFIRGGRPVADYSCNSEYTIMSENSRRECQFGEWSGNEPTCGNKDIINHLLNLAPIREFFIRKAWIHEK